MRKIGYIVLTILLSLIIAFNLCSIFNVSFFHYRVYRIATGSMVPNLKVGELILVKDDSKYMVGDVVTYAKNNVYITHRIVQIDGDNVVTKGDNNNVNDDAITKNDVVGKMVYKLKIIGFINYLFSKPFTWILAFMIGIVIVLLIPNYKIKKGNLIDNEVL